MITKEMQENAVYLGDGAYLTNDGYQLWLFTSNGYHVVDSIALEDKVFDNLVTNGKDFFNKKRGEQNDS